MCVKVPGKVAHLEKAVERLGGVAHLARSIRKVHTKVRKAEQILQTKSAKLDEAKTVKFEGQSSDEMPMDGKVSKRERKFFLSH